MKKKTKGLLTFAAGVFLLAAAGCGARNAGEDARAEEEVSHIIGVTVYDQDSAEMQMFMNYYKNYVAEGFPVTFYFSDELNDGADEEEFIREVKKKGAEGVISFYAQDLQGACQACREEEMYYIAGSGTVDDEDFQAVKDNPWFLGTIGPDPEEEKQAGSNMASYFQEQGVKSYLILTGGADLGNFMHASRTVGMLETLESLEGLSYQKSPRELAAAEEMEEVDTGNPEVSVTLVPGFVGSEEGEAKIKEALAAGPYDAILCSYGINGLVDLLNQAETAWGQDAKIGLVDCFSEENFQLVKGTDAYGNPKFDYLEGKYASMIGPAFAAMYNAITGHGDVVRPEGQAFRLYQSFWVAAGREEYAEMYGYTQGIYENAYSNSDLMEVIAEYNPEANWEAFKALTEASDLASVKARILQQN